jgi:hypothetical protein
MCPMIAAWVQPAACSACEHKQTVQVNHTQTKSVWMLMLSG